MVPVTYTQFQTKLRDLISCTGRDKRSFLATALERGGGCRRAFKSRVKSELIQFHGDWVSDWYLSYDFHQKLSVLQKMRARIINDMKFYCML